VSETESLTAVLNALIISAKGAPPAVDFIEQLGGWQYIADELPGTLDDPVSAVLIRIIARDAAAPGAAQVLASIADTVVSIESPTGIADSLEAVLASPAFLDTAGPRLAERLLAQVTAFKALSDSSLPEVSRAASSLEALTRLAVGGYSSKFALLALLEKFTAPQPKRFAAAVVRSVGTTIDCWPDAASLTEVVDAVAGLKPPIGAQAASADPADIASDATWVLANIELVQALRADTADSMTSHLDASINHLAIGAETYDRDDAKILALVLQIVVALVRGETGPTALDTALPGAGELGKLVESQTMFNLAMSGLNHWYGDVKRHSTTAWVRLVEDLVRARTEFAAQAFYRPEAVIGDLLEVYRASRSMEVVRRIEDFDGVLDVVQPVIEAGFGSNNAFVANLAVYTSELAAQLEVMGDDGRCADLRAQHDTAAQVLEHARHALARRESPGKDASGTVVAPLPRRLEQILSSDPVASAKVAELGPYSLQLLETALAGSAAARRITLQEDRIVTDLKAALAASPDYVGDVAAAIDEIMFAMVRFVGYLQNVQSDTGPYLFEEEPAEKSLQDDLHRFLLGIFGANLIDIEVAHVGGGRADLRVHFGSFSVYLELKVDATRKPLAEKGAYLNQAATYQATDVRIGFVVALRIKAFPRAGSHPHLTSLFSHATVDVAGDSQPRHLVLVEVPGNRSSPAAKKASVS